MIASSEERQLLASADLFVNPVLGGSGTSREAVEALAGLLPLVATPVSVSDLGLEPGKHALLCERDEFAPAVRSLLARPRRRRRIAEAGLARVQSQFTWRKIARQFARNLMSATKETDHAGTRSRSGGRRSRVVVLGDHATREKEEPIPVWLDADIVRLALGPALALELARPGELRITLEKSTHHQAFEQQSEAAQGVSVSDIATGLFVANHHSLADVLSILLPRSNAVIFDRCVMAPALDIIKRIRSDLPILYHARDIETTGMEPRLQRHPLRAPLENFVGEIERRLAAAADVVVTHREDDAKHLRGLGARSVIVANGKDGGPPAEMLKTRANGQDHRRSLLVVTYRYTEPPLGGAEEYLIAILRWLRPRFRSIDLAAVDVVGPLTNLHHHGCGFTAGSGAARIVGELFDSVRLFPPDIVPKDRALEACRQLERFRMRSEFALYTPFAEDLRKRAPAMLLGGFYWLEEQDGFKRRWTAPEFSFLIPRGAKIFGFDGWSPKRQWLVVSVVSLGDGQESEAIELHRQLIEAGFSCRLALSDDVTADVIRCVVEEHIEPGDYRSLGIVVERASVLVGTAQNPPAGANVLSAAAPLREIEMDLGTDVEPTLRTAHLDAWLDRLSALARDTSDADEAALASVRGPHSKALQAWLAENGMRYDVVLVQGVPFDTVPSTVATLKRLDQRPRIVVLPHFHGGDRYYYWRRYIDSFAAADKTLFFSERLARRLGQPAKNAVVPGGGVDIEEEARDDLVAQFREVHQETAPFFLVLGRKIASKGYDRVMRAVGALRDAGRMIDVVMIGSDEDEAPVEQDGIYYLGFQPRDIVLGALSACLAVVTMSDSESFGIVVCEAWKFRKPVVASRACAAFRDLIADRETGLLVSSDAELVAALTEIAKDGALRNRLGAAGFARAAAEFSWQRVADQVAEVLIDGAKSRSTKLLNLRIGCDSLPGT